MSPDTPLVARIAPSPNHNDRRGRTIDCAVLHYTGMATGEAALARLCDPAAEVSAHYLVWPDGLIEQLVPEGRRAWHAGRSFWQGETDVNSVSIGIEMVNRGHEGGCPPYPIVQVDAVVALLADIMARRMIAPDRVLAHSDVAPDRKQDPGEHFPWERLAAHGITPRLPTTPVEARMMTDAALLHLIGYACDEPGGVAAALSAFQRRWRPRLIDGLADAETLVLLAKVAALRVQA